MQTMDTSLVTSGTKKTLTGRQIHLSQSLWKADPNSLNIGF